MIRRTVYSLLSLLLGYSAAPCQIALTHATVVDVRSGSLKRNMTIVISGRRIESVGPARGTSILKKTQIIDGRWLYVIPGLWDMHIHIGTDERALRLLVAAGITGARDMGGKHREAYRITTPFDVQGICGAASPLCGTNVGGAAYGTR